MRRRDVSKGGAAGAAGLAAPRVWTEGVPVGENREPWIALLSDTHIDADPG